MRFEISKSVTVYAATVRAEDMVRVGTANRRVLDMRALHGGAKLLLFGRGETFTLSTSASLLANRNTSVTIS
jgi:hypothetical protein